MAQTVIYCGICGLPPEYCEYGPTFEKCIPWLKENISDIEKIYPQLKDDTKPTPKEKDSTTANISKRPS